jgi:hypothetical protein
VSTPAVLSLADIAVLAHVQRPVVSVWRSRRRTKTGEIPFPSPVQVIARSERFDREEIVAWLEATGRGNNFRDGHSQVRLDAPAVTPPADADLEDVVVLLCLAALAGEELATLTDNQLLDLSADLDADDNLVCRELPALVERRDLLKYVDDLMEASFGPADALDRAEAGRLGRDRGERGVTNELVDVVRAVVAAARTYIGEEDVLLAPPSDAQLAAGLIDGFAGVVVVDDDEPARRLRRRLAIREAVLDATHPGMVKVASVLGQPVDAVLQAADELALGLAEQQVAVLVGPANALCDQLNGQYEKDRSGTLRLGKLALALRLPRGMWREAHRQHLAIWVFRGRNEPIERIRVADLEGELIALDDLTSDVLGALEQSDERAYRYARAAELAPIRAKGPVVPRGARALRFGTTAPATCLDRVHAASLTTGEEVPGFDIEVAAGPGQVLLRHRSLRELELAKLVKVRRSHQINLDLADPRGTVPVLSADGRTAGVYLDPFDAAKKCAGAARTDPGDVIFIDKPRPMALVDTVGGGLVASPSRILRLLPGAPIGPHALAALINELAPSGTEWETWAVPEMSAAAAAALDLALAAAADHLRILRAHEHAMQDLTRNLIDGVAAGAIMIDTTRKAG